MHEMQLAGALLDLCGCRMHHLRCVRGYHLIVTACAPCRPACPQTLRQAWCCLIPKFVAPNVTVPEAPEDHEWIYPYSSGAALPQPECRALVRNRQPSVSLGPFKGSSTGRHNCTRPVALSAQHHIHWSFG